MFNVSTVSIEKTQNKTVYSQLNRTHHTYISSNSPQIHQECKTTRAGLDYMGTESRTMTGHKCQAWNSQKPHQHEIGCTDKEFPEKDVDLAKNYCRNPDNDTQGPWCYTADLEKKYDYCMIHMCSEPAAGIHPECKDDRRGLDYQGKINHSREGHVCMPWVSFSFNDNFPDRIVDEAFNYCRNPVNFSLGPWCYLNHPNIIWQYCMIHMCSEPAAGIHPECKEDETGLSYQGKLNRTIFGHACISWIMVNGGFYKFPTDTVDEAFNYCRNPDNDTFGPWCFTNTDSGKYTGQRCGIPICGVSDNLNDIYVNHTGYSYQKDIWSNIAEIIIQFVFPIISFCGTVLNGFSLCTFSRPSLKSSTTAFLLIILTTTDTISLCMGALEKWFETYTGRPLAATSDLSCRTYWYIWYIFRTSSAWVLVTITLDRVINMAKPYKAGTICTKRNACIVLIFMLACICACYTPVILYFEKFTYLYFDENGIEFTVRSSCVYDNANSLKWVEMSAHCFLPFTFMVIGNIGIIFLLYDTIKTRMSIKQGSAANNHSDFEQLISLAVLLIITCFIYLILTLPYVVYVMYHTFHGFSTLGENQLFFVCSMCCEYINYSLNFLLYCLASKHFRKVFLTMIRWERWFICCASNIVSPAPINVQPTNQDVVQINQGPAKLQQVSDNMTTPNRPTHTIEIQPTIQKIPKPSTSTALNKDKPNVCDVDI